MLESPCPALVHMSLQSCRFISKCPLQNHLDYIYYLLLFFEMFKSVKCFIFPLHSFYKSLTIF